MSISKQEYQRRRQRLMESMEPGSIAIVPSARLCIRSRDSEYAFRQDSDFSYLCGFDEPDAVLVLLPGRESGEFILFCRDRDPAMELWNGYRAGPEGACSEYGADDAFPIDDIDEILPGLIEGRQRLYYAMGRHAEFDQHVMQWVNAIRSKVRSGAQPPGEFLDLDHLLHDMRLFKSAAELKIMRQAGEVSARAHSRAMRFCQPGVYEYQLEAEIQHEFAMAGARFPAYSSIVGGGANACILHYTENQDAIADGSLILIDAGAEYNGYAADITRTFPVNGRFSKAQAALYQLVLDAQEQAIDQLVPGATLPGVTENVVKVLTTGLCELGLLKESVEDALENKSWRRFFMHGLGHYLGLDVHDVGEYTQQGSPRPLEPGMVITVEPGLYVPNESDIAESFRGTGIRIEDNLVITATGNEVLTNGVPKSIQDIEALMEQ